MLQFANFAGESRRIAVFPSTDVRLSDRLVYCPDLSVYAAARMPRIPARLTGPPDLVVEILSPRSRQLDLVTKRGDYDRFGVSEYWVVDPETGGIRCWARATDGLEEGAVQANRLDSAVIEGFSLDLAALRRVVGESQE